MSNEVQRAEALVILAAAGVALYLGYKVYKTGAGIASAAGEAVNAVGDLVSSAGQAVGEAGHQVAAAARTAYAEVQTFITGRQHYSPDALEGSMTRAQAEQLAKEIEARQALEESAEWDSMIRNELDRLGSNHPADAGSDPSLPYIGYRP